MMEERERLVDHTTIYRWVQQYAPKLEKRCRPHLKTPRHMMLERPSMSSQKKTTVERENKLEERKKEKCLQQGMRKCTTLLAAVKPLRFP